MIKILWHHYNDTPNRRIFFSNLSGKDHAIVIKTDNPEVPGTSYTMKANEKTMNYPLEDTCHATVYIGDGFSKHLSFLEEDISATFTIVDR